MSHAATSPSLGAPAPTVSGETASAAGPARLPSDDELRQISASLRGLRYGSVTIIVQDGVVIQIDRTEKRRLRDRTGDASRSS